MEAIKIFEEELSYLYSESSLPKDILEDDEKSLLGKNFSLCGKEFSVITGSPTMFTRTDRYDSDSLNGNAPIDPTLAVLHTWKNGRYTIITPHLKGIRRQRDIWHEVYHAFYGSSEYGAVSFSGEKLIKSGFDIEEVIKVLEYIEGYSESIEYRLRFLAKPDETANNMFEDYNQKVFEKKIIDVNTKPTKWTEESNPYKDSSKYLNNIN